MSSPSTVSPGATDHAEWFTSSLNLLLITTACASTLVPISAVLFYFSTSRTRRRPVFILNVVLILLGLGLGLVNMFLQMQIMMDSDVWPGILLLYTLLTILIPTLADSVLLVRVVTVYPLHALPPFYRVIVYAPIASIKTFRLIIDIMFIAAWSRAVFDHGYSPFDAGQHAWNTPFPKIAWLLQLLDSTYASALFLHKLRQGPICPHRIRIAVGGAETDSVESAGTASTYYNRVQTLFWIATSNFVFPAALDLVQLVLAFRDPDFVRGAYVLVVNNYVSIVGVLLATIWSTSTKEPAGQTRGGEESPRFASPSPIEEPGDGRNSCSMGGVALQGVHCDVEMQRPVG
ncbi:hypothetical protein C8Q76DRAFT_634448 [Earliella scabrosa]|nr:hypothetical protein C8Q76DRAFT_634448 [Earliella scabrosa]